MSDLYPLYHSSSQVPCNVHASSKYRCFPVLGFRSLSYVLGAIYLQVSDVVILDYTIRLSFIRLQLLPIKLYAFCRRVEAKNCTVRTAWCGSCVHVAGVDMAEGYQVLDVLYAVDNVC